MRDCRGGKRGRWIVAQAVDVFMFSLLITTFLLNRFTTRTMMATTNGHHTHNYTPLLAPEHAQDASAGLFFCFTYSTNVFSFFLIIYLEKTSMWKEKDEGRDASRAEFVLRALLSFW